MATLLRAHHTPADPDEYPHSYITLRIRGEVIEGEHILMANLAYMTAFSSLHAHEKADVEQGSQRTNEIYFDAISQCMPYLTGGKTGKDIQQEERMQAVEQYRKMKEAVMKKPGGIDPDRYGLQERK